jgi:hypothetical protein
MCDAGHEAGGLMARTLDCRHGRCRELVLDEALAARFREALRAAAARSSRHGLVPGGAAGP